MCRTSSSLLLVRLHFRLHPVKLSRYLRDKRLVLLPRLADRQTVVDWVVRSLPLPARSDYVDRPTNGPPRGTGPTYGRTRLICFQIIATFSLDAAAAGPPMRWKVRNVLRFRVTFQVMKTLPAKRYNIKDVERYSGASRISLMSTATPSGDRRNCRRDHVIH